MNIFATLLSGLKGLNDSKSITGQDDVKNGIIIIGTSRQNARRRIGHEYMDLCDYQIYAIY